MSQKFVLVVDDTEGILHLFKRYLVRMGREVILASNGLEAWRIIKERGSDGIDHIFTDAEMPEMGGVELALRTRRELKTATIPITIMSSREALPSSPNTRLEYVCLSIQGDTRFYYKPSGGIGKMLAERLGV